MAAARKAADEAAARGEKTEVSGGGGLHVRGAIRGHRAQRGRPPRDFTRFTVVQWGGSVYVGVAAAGFDAAAAGSGYASETDAGWDGQMLPRAPDPPQ